MKSFSLLTFSFMLSAGIFLTACSGKNEPKKSQTIPSKTSAQIVSVISKNSSETGQHASWKILVANIQKDDAGLNVVEMKNAEQMFMPVAISNSSR